ncbi:uncharacterized protein N7473_008503 [Penicillium subrubescens]|uniref:uncharacterized protein n=1 Tax=Penicillium subrubescens TaxID=1316194 RepID=UPI00254552D9|nr:uncharacterized protein N7473_008503 [Penicillium subrubescens]KAJ5892275.1 hypothetical protein N7473_008503 [Penicillium subrubescens]
MEFLIWRSYVTNITPPMQYVYGGETMLGFNRGNHNRTNTYLAVLEAKKRVLSHLWSIELGNEPDVYLWQNKADAVIPWNASQEGADAANWAQGFIDAWKSPSRSSLQAHTPLAIFAERVFMATFVNRSFILGETNFHPYDVGMDEPFGAALATLDKSLHVVTLGIQRLYFHQGTINQGEHIVELDSGNGSYAQYVIYSKGRPTKAVLVNTDYFSGSGVRTKSTIRLNGLVNSRVKAVRMTAASSEVTTNGTASYPIIGGQFFSNVDCSSIGALTYKKTAVTTGKVTITVAASEALLLYL